MGENLTVTGWRLEIVWFPAFSVFDSISQDFENEWRWINVHASSLDSSQVVLCGLLLLQSTSQIVPNMDQNSSAEGITVITGFFTAAFWDIQVECQLRSFYMNHTKSYRLNVGSFQ